MGAKSTNQDTGFAEPFWANKSKKYMFEFVNNSGQAIVFNVKTTYARGR